MTTRSALVALLACAAVAGCGSDDDQRAPAPPRLTDAEQVAATVRRQMQAVARGDGEAACSLFSPRALQQVMDLVSRRAGDVGCVTAVQQGAAALPRPALAALRRPSITDVRIRRDRATVEVRLPADLTVLARGVGAGAGGIRLRLIDGRWRVDGPAR